MTLNGTVPGPLKKGEREERVCCIWFVDGKLQNGVFSPETLKKS